MMRLCLCAIALLFISNAQAEESNVDTKKPETTQISSPSAPAAPSAAPTPLPQLPNPYSEERTRHLAIGVFVSGKQTAKFDEAFLTSPSGTGPLKIEFEIEPATGFTIEYRNMPKNAWGLQAGLSYESNQNVTKVTMKGSGGTLTANVIDLKYRATTFYVNATYRWNEFYIPFGLNVSRPVFEPETAATLSGGLGGQAGIGYQFTELFGLELISNANYIKGRETSGSSTLDYGDGYVSSLRLQGKFAL